MTSSNSKIRTLPGMTGTNEWSRHQRGFSLIEIMVALAILALAVSVVVPGAVDMVERFDRLTERRLAEDAVNDCRLAAVTSQNVIVFAPSGPSDTGPGKVGSCGVLPAGWRAQTDGEFIFSPAAVCLGTSISLIDPAGTRFRYNLDSNTCRLIAV